jgi:hypothetical protein
MNRDIAKARLEKAEREVINYSKSIYSNLDYKEAIRASEHLAQIWKMGQAIVIEQDRVNQYSLYG